MKVIKPTVLTAALIHAYADSEPGTGETAWNAGTNYTVGTRAIRTTTHRVYEALAAGVDAGLPESTPARWLDVGPTNRWAMFDNVIGTATQLAAGPLTVVLKPGLCNSITLLGLAGTAAQVQVQDGLGGTLLFDRTASLDGTIITDWYQYYYEPRVQLGELIITDLPPRTNAHITVTITGPGAVACGVCVVGTFYDLGDTRYGLSTGIVDYSRKEADEFGNVTLVRRPYSRRMTASLEVPNSKLRKVDALLIGLRATPCVWIGADGDLFTHTIVYGFFKDFGLEVAYATKSLCSLEIEGLT